MSFSTFEFLALLWTAFGNCSLGSAPQSHSERVENRLQSKAGKLESIHRMWKLVDRQLMSLL